MFLSLLMFNTSALAVEVINVDSNKGIVTCRYEAHGGLVAEMKCLNTAVHALRNNRLKAKSAMDSK